MIDFDKLDTLVNIGWKRRRDQKSCHREPLGELRMRRANKSSKAGKAHSTNRERSYADRAKHAASALLVGKQAAQSRAYLEAVRAYWAGLRDEHP